MSSTIPNANTLGKILNKADLLLDHKRNNVPLEFEYLDGGAVRFSHACIDGADAVYYHGHINDVAVYSESNDTFTMVLNAAADSTSTKLFVVRAVSCSSVSATMAVTKHTSMATGVTLMSLARAASKLYEVNEDDELLTFENESGITLKHLHGSDDEIVVVPLDTCLSYDAMHSHFILDTPEREYRLIPYKDVDLSSAAMADEDLNALTIMLDRLAGNHR